MLAANGPAGVAPEVNLKNPFQAVEEACIEGSTLALKPRVDVTKSPKQSISSPTKRMMPSNFLKKKRVEE